MHCNMASSPENSNFLDLQSSIPVNADTHTQAQPVIRFTEPLPDNKLLPKFTYLWQGAHKKTQESIHIVHYFWSILYYRWPCDHSDEERILILCRGVLRKTSAIYVQTGKDGVLEMSPGKTGSRLFFWEERWPCICLQSQLLWISKFWKCYSIASHLTNKKIHHQNTV